MFKKSRAKRLEGCLALAGAAAASALLPPWQMRWGGNDIEIGLFLPGDELVPIKKLAE
jgi:hypothetical protein